MVGRPRASDIAVRTPAGLFRATQTRSSRAGIRRPSTRMTWRWGSTRAPNRRTISPSTSTRPSPIISSQCLRLPTPAAASTFCSRIPPGTSTSVSWPSWAPWSRPRWLMTCVWLVVKVIGKERGELGQRVEAGQPQSLQEVRGRREQDRARPGIGAGLLDQPAQDQEADHAVAADAADGGYPGAANRLAGDAGRPGF